VQAMTYHHVLVPITGDASDNEAIQLAASVVDSKEISLSLLYVVEVAPEYPLEAELPREVEIAEEALAVASSYARYVLGERDTAITADLLQARAAGPAIVDEASLQHVEVIVMALRNQRKHGRPTVGDTVPYVLKNAPCEVILRRQPASRSLDKCDWPLEVEPSG
jgi:nucleotide-binding universal stress UspA family protein